MERITSPGMLLAAVVGLTLVPCASWSLIVPSVVSPAWPSQQESCCTNGVRPRSLWGAQQCTRRRSECSSTVMSTASDNARRQHSKPRGGDWGASAKYLSAWVSGTTPISRSSLHASSPTGLGAWWTGGFWGGGGNNGTDSGVPTGDAMDGGDSRDGGADVNVCYNFRADYGSVPPKSSKFGPWVWLSALWGLYAVWLKQSPMLTKALTAGVLALGGDIAAQCFEFQQDGRPGAFLKADTRRLAAVAIDSVLITGPALHALYGLMERLVPTVGGGFLPAAAHLLVDTLVFDPIFVASFFCVTGMLQNRSLRQDVLPALRREFWPAVRGAWGVSLFFCPFQYVTFRYLPLEFRVLSVNVCDIVWTSVLSYFSHKAVPIPGGQDAGANSINRDKDRRGARVGATG